ncbi:MAG: creatininase family protein [Candidatus Odinarchaeota archaeon]|nr:creatininase family protein [Candidatus Odinarchaeota archaeon]
MTTKEIFYLTYPKVKKLIKDVGINRAILPIGTIEAHGPHLPLGTDVLIPYELAKSLADKLNALVLPPINYGVVTSLLGHPGSITLSDDTLQKMVYEIITSFSRHGIKTFIILNGHGGNNIALESVARRLWVEQGLHIILIHWWIYSANLTKSIFEEPSGHAGIDETAAILATHPELVDTSVDVKKEVYLAKQGVKVYPNPGSIFLYNEEMKGLPRFDKSLSKKFWDALIAELESLLSRLLEDLSKKYSHSNSL